MRAKFLLTLFIPALLVGCGNNQPQQDKNKLKEVTLESEPTKTNYVVDEFFEPAGLSIKTLTFGGQEDIVIYSATNDKFTFTPSLTTPLTLEDTSVKVTYEGFDLTVSITVNEPVIPTYSHSINFQNAQITKTTDTSTFEERFLPNFIHEGEQLLANLQTAGFLQVVKNDQTIEYTSWSEKVLSIGNGDGGRSLELTFKDKLISVEIEARAHVKFYLYGDKISADSNSVLHINNSSWTFPTPTFEEYDTETKRFTVNSNKLTLSTNDVANGRVTIFKITFNLELKD